MSTHVYSITTDFTGLTEPAPNFDLLSVEILDDGGNLATLDYIDRLGDTVTIEFTAVLSGAEITTLDATVAAHTGTLSAAAIQNEFDTADELNYREFTYTLGELLDTVEYYSDAPKTLLEYTKQLNYNGSELLTTLVLTRAADSAVFTKTLTYDVGENLTDVDLT